MSWLRHPKFVPVRDATLRAFKQKEYHFRKAKWVIFLCGGSNSPKRDRLAAYITAKHSGVLLFYADDVWKVLASRADQNALQMESELAALSDMVCLLVESPGTLAELGAFSMNPQLRRKLLPILDKTHRYMPSFVNTGPLHWVDSVSRFAPTIWANTSSILLCAAELDERIGRLEGERPPPVKDITDQHKFVLFLLCDLLFVLGPSTLGDLQFYIAGIIGPIYPAVLDRLTALGYTMKLLERYDIDGETYFYRTVGKGHFPSFQATDFYRLPTLRTEVRGVLLRIPTAAGVFEAIGQHISDDARR